MSAATARPRVLFVGRERHVIPLPPHQQRKWEAVGARLDFHVLGACRSPQPVDPRFTLYRPIEPRPIDGAAFYALLPFRVARAIRRFRPEAIWVQGVHEAAACIAAVRLSGSTAKVLLDVQGDWRTATRLYGSRARNLLTPLGDGLARFSIRGADGVRTISPHTTALVRELAAEPLGEFPTFTDLEAFAAAPQAPVPTVPRAVFVGVLERYKNVDGLAAAWRLAAPRVPAATLQLVGQGTLRAVAERLVADLPEQTEWTPSVANADLPRVLDAATLLVLPSRAEGMGRVIIEAFLRGRPVIGSRAGAIPDLVRPGENGLLVDAERPDELANALVQLLSDRELAERLGSGALASAPRWSSTPDEYAARVANVVTAMLRRPA